MPINKTNFAHAKNLSQTTHSISGVVLIAMLAAQLITPIRPAFTQASQSGLSIAAATVNSAPQRLCVMQLKNA